MALTSVARTKAKKLTAKVKSKEEAIGKSNAQKVNSSGSKYKKAKKTSSELKAAVVKEKSKSISGTTETLSKKKSGKHQALDALPEALTIEDDANAKTTESPKASKSGKVNKTQNVISSSKPTSKRDSRLRSKGPSNEAPASSISSKKKQMTSDTTGAVDVADPPSAERADQEDEEILLHGFSSESDSSDEDDGVDEAPVDLGKLPTVAKDDATVKKKLEKAKRAPIEDRGVLYLGRIPHGFYEDEMKAYFSQFGDITRLRISRNKKTGRSKHYGFIEFASSAVAQVVSETMDNYLLMGHILRCKIIPKEDVHSELWIGSNKKYRRVPYDRIVRLQQNKTRTEEEQEKAEKRLLRRQEEKKRKLNAAGIDYDFDSVAYKKPKAVE